MCMFAPPHLTISQSVSSAALPVSLHVTQFNGSGGGGNEEHQIQVGGRFVGLKRWDSL